jgi:DNA-binding transcriptional regulator YiaG
VPTPRQTQKPLKRLTKDRSLPYLWAMRGKQICYVRQKLFLSQEAMARLMGVSVGTVGRWEREEAIPRLRHQAKLKKLFLRALA